MTTGEKAKILVIDDEENVRELLRYLLDSAGYSLQTASDGDEGLKVFFSWRPDLVLLDVLMPKMDGWSLLGRIRELSDTPVLMLTALGQEHQKVRGLRGGADDYIAKPFGRDELLARVEAILRRTESAPQTEDAYKDEVLHVDFERHRVFARSSQVELSPIEFRLLVALVRSAGVVLSPERLLDLCWGERSGGPGNVRVYINYLRRKLEEDPSSPVLIETVREFGYRYRPPQEKDA